MRGILILFNDELDFMRAYNGLKSLGYELTVDSNNFEILVKNEFEVGKMLITLSEITFTTGCLHRPSRGVFPKDIVAIQ